MKKEKIIINGKKVDCLVPDSLYEEAKKNTKRSDN